jgi:hypothetical protein
MERWLIDFYCGLTLVEIANPIDQGAMENFDESIVAL